ncbi:MAG: DNA recombination protein RmuC [Thermodesulfobacteriota bacterium]
MIDANSLLFLLAGLVIGAVLVGVFLRLLTDRRISESLRPLQSEAAAMEERLKGRDLEVQTLSRENREKEEELDRLRQSLLEESRERASAQKETEQIGELRIRLQEQETELKNSREEIIRLKQNETELETLLHKERQVMEEKIRLLDEAATKMEDAFKALSAQCLASNNQQFLDLARTTLEKYQSQAKTDLEQRQKAVEGAVLPLKETLEKYTQQVQAMETARQQAYGSLSQYLESMAVAEKQLQKETSNLVQALRSPQVRGRWGEITLKRVAELAGMSEHCDFYEQESVEGEGGKLRPDMVVRLPNQKLVVVDSKAPLQSYLDSLDSPTEEERKNRLRDHARLIQSHLKKLAGKEYWDQFSEAPEFVILFLPGENFFSAALEQNPYLIEEGVNRRVILSTPTTLITLLRAVAYGWRQEALAENAQAISELGKTLFERLVKFGGHFADLGRHLDKSLTAYNEVVGSLESRILPAARRFKELGISSKAQVPALTSLEKKARRFQSREFFPEIEAEEDPVPEEE